MARLPTIPSAALDRSHLGRSPMRSWIIASAVLIAGLGALWAGTQNTGPTNDEAGLRKAAQNLVAAMQAGDAAAVGGFWADDADYCDETGNHVKGRDAVVN